MSQMSIDDLPPSEVEHLARKILEQMRSMDEADQRILNHSRDSLINFVAELARALAAVAGFIIALPIAWAVRFTETVVEGFRSGWDAAFRSVRGE